MSESPQRRFKAGDKFKVEDIHYRVVPGRKGPRDLRLEWASAGFAWRPVTLDHVGLIVDVIGDNENVLYPPPASGNAKVVKFIRQVFTEGWRSAVYNLQLERDHKHYRELFEPEDGAA